MLLFIFRLLNSLSLYFGLAQECNNFSANNWESVLFFVLLSMETVEFSHSELFDLVELHSIIVSFNGDGNYITLILFLEKLI